MPICTGGCRKWGRSGAHGAQRLSKVACVSQRPPGLMHVALEPPTLVLQAIEVVRQLRVAHVVSHGRQLLVGAGRSAIYTKYMHSRCCPRRLLVPPHRSPLIGRTHQVGPRSTLAPAHSARRCPLPPSKPTARRARPSSVLGKQMRCEGAYLTRVERPEAPLRRKRGQPRGWGGGPAGKPRLASARVLRAQPRPAACRRSRPRSAAPMRRAA